VWVGSATGLLNGFWPWRRNCKLTDYSQQVIGAPNLCSLPQVLPTMYPIDTLQCPLQLPNTIVPAADCCSKVVDMQFLQDFGCAEHYSSLYHMLTLQNTFGPDASFLYGQCVFTTPDPASLALTQVHTS
jgi:hypothetical protein